MRLLCYFVQLSWQRAFVSTIVAHGGAHSRHPLSNSKFDLREVQDLVHRAQEGDRDAVPALRAYPDAHPSIWQQVGDLAAETEQAPIRIVSGDDLTRAKCLTRKLAELKLQLVGATPTPVERLVAARIVLS